MKVGGRISSIRDVGKMLFITIRSDGEFVQLVAAVGPTMPMEKLQEIKSSLRTGHIVGATGYLGKTKRGEPSVFLTDCQVVAPFACTDLTVCPDQRGFRAVLGDAELKYRYRFLDLACNPPRSGGVPPPSAGCESGPCLFGG